MHVTKNVEKIRTLYGGKLHSFVSYFQSVITVGVITTARNPHEAESLAKEKLAQGNFVSGIFNQSPFTLAETEEWHPDVSGVAIGNNRAKSNVDLVVSLSDDILNRIAKKLSKKPEEVNEADCLQFLKSTLDNSLA